MADDRVTIGVVLRDRLSGPLGKINDLLRGFFRTLTRGETGIGRTFVAALRRAGAGFRRLGQESRRLIGVFDRLKRLVFNLKTLFAGLVIGFTARSTLLEVAKIERGVLEVASLISDVSQETITQLRRDIGDLAAEGGQRIEDEIGAAYNALSAGVEQENLLTFLGTANRLAVGGVTDVNTAVGLLTGVLNAYGRSAAEAEDVSDTLFTTVRLGKTTIEELAGSVGRVAPIASELELSLEEVSAAYIELTKSLGSTTAATTGLLGVIRTLVRPSVEAEEIARKYNVELGVGAVRANGFTETLSQLSAIAQQNADDFQKLFGEQTAWNSASILGRNNAEGFTVALDALSNRAGATQSAFDLLSQSLLFQLQRLRTAFAVLFDEILRTQVSELGRIVGQIANIVQTLTSIIRAANAENIDFNAVARAFGSVFNLIRQSATAIGRAIGTAIVEAFTVALVAATPLLQAVLRDIVAPVLNDFLSNLPGFGGDLIEVGDLTKLNRAERALRGVRGLVDQIRKDGELIKEIRDDIESAPLIGSTIAEEERIRVQPVQRRIRENLKFLEETAEEYNVPVDRLEASLERDVQRLEATLRRRGEQTADAFQTALIDGFTNTSEAFAEITPTIVAGLEDLDQALQEIIQPVTDEAAARQAAEAFARGFLGPSIDRTNEEAEAASTEQEVSRIDRLRDAYSRLQGVFRTLGRERLAVLELQARTLAATGQETEAARLRLQIAQEQERVELQEELGDAYRVLLPLLRQAQALERQQFEGRVVIANQLDRVTEAEQKYREALELLNEQTEAGLPITSQQTARVRELENALRDAGRAATVELEKLSGTPGIGPEAEAALGRVKDTVASIGQQTGNTATTFREGLGAAIDELAVKAEINADKARVLIDGIANSISSNLTNAILAVVDGTRDFATAFRNAAAQILRNIAQMIIQMLIFRAVSGALSGGATLFAPAPTGFASGGKVNGPDAPEGVDNIPAMLQADEWVINRRASRFYGDRIMAGINRMLVPRSVLGSYGARTSRVAGSGYAGGGRVGQPASGPQAALSGSQAGGMGSTASTPPIALVVGNESTMERLLAGGTGAMLRFFQERSSEINQILENR